jgi:hypothetical protein
MVIDGQTKCSLLREVIPIWDCNGNLVSAGFPKFTNWGENPDNFPLPKSIDGTTAIEKIDGSSLIVSNYKNETIIRTRGTFDVFQHPNGQEIKDLFYNMLCKISDPVVSYIFEWVTPSNKIVIGYDKPELYLIGAIDHNDYSLYSQVYLNAFAKSTSNTYGIEIKRPPLYNFKDIDDLLLQTKDWKGKEGIVLYSNNGQSLHKVKSLWYLSLHHMKDELANVERVIDVWLSLNKPDYNTFYNYIVTTFDFELANMTRGNLSKVCEAYKEVLDIINHMHLFVNNIKSLSTRKEQAAQIISSYGKTNRASFLFNILDGRNVSDDDIKKLLFQVLK